jgi:predicted nucleic acid-binding protein
MADNSIVCDSSALISLTDSCFVNIFYELSRRLDGHFLIPKSVEDECVTVPMRSRQHALHAIRIKQAVSDGVLHVVTRELSDESHDLSWIANNIFFMGERPVKLLHRGETEMLALAHELGVKNILIDERTTRMLAESPWRLKRHLEDEFRHSVSVNEEFLERFSGYIQGMSFFRSTELLIAAYEHGFFKAYKDMEQDMLLASLYSLKNEGCAVSFDEIESFVKELRK